MYLTKITTVRFAGVPDGAAVDLSLVKLPADALIFPCPPTHGEPFSFAKLRSREMSQTGSELLPPSSVSSFACTISGARMRRYCLTLACPYMWLPHAAVMIRQSCCGAMPSAPARRTDQRRALSGNCPVAC